MCYTAPTMPHTLRRVVVYALIALVILPPTVASAAEPAAEPFNPNFILSDEELQDWRSMTRADIQAFLSDHKGKISSMRHVAVDGEERTTADIIYRAAKDNQINPKYLLVKLQKEQSLITDKDPTQKQLDWATGYSVCDSCSTTDPDIQKNKGFGIQVDKAAGIMRWYYDNAQQESWIKRSGKKYTIDGQTVTPQNDATAFLYTYTPHIHGNQNFWTLWQRWFDQVYPDGTLVKRADDSRVYLIQEGKKRLFKSFSALATRFDPKLIVTVPTSELARYKDGAAISLPNYAVLKQADQHYLLDYDELRPFASPDVVRQLGYHPDEIIEVASADLEDYVIGRPISGDGSPIGELVRLTEDGVLYFFEDGLLHPLFDDQIAAINFPQLTERSVSIADIGNPAIGDPIIFKDGTLILIEGSNMVYVIEHGKKRHIASEDVFTGLGLSWSNLVRTNTLTGLHIPNGQKLYLRQATPTDPPNEPESASESPQEESPEEPHEPDYRDLMQRTPEAAWEFIGPAFETDVDAYLVADADSLEVLAGKNIDVVRPTASLTKVMTGYRVMKEGLSLRRVTQYDPEDHNGVYHRFRVAPGEKIFNSDLLDASLVSSLNTPTRMLVDSVEENEQRFVERMNAQARDWELTHTTFVDVTGESEHNVTTAREYLHLFVHATNNQTVHDQLKKRSYAYDEFIDLDDKPHHFDTHSNALMHTQELPFTVLESKTGYLYDSGANLAMRIRRKSDSKEFYVITLGNGDFERRFDEPERLARWTLERF